MCSLEFNSLRPHPQLPARLLCPWDSPDKNTGVASHFLFQGVFLTQELNLSLLFWQVDSFLPSHQGSPELSLASPISPSAAHFSCPQSFPAPGSFPMSRLFASSDQSIGASSSVLPTNTLGWFPWGLTGLIYLQSKAFSRVFSCPQFNKFLFF